MTPNGRLVQMAYRNGTNDWSTLQSCLSGDEYALKGLDPKGWALDIGGYLGGVGIGLAMDHPSLEVVIVEPVPDNARLIRENVERNGLSNVTVLEAAIGAPGQGKAEVAYAYTGSESALHHAFVGNSTIIDRSPDCTVKEVPAFSLSEIQKLTNEAEPPSLVKTDTEGGEWQMFKDPLCRRVPLWVGEWHPTEGHTQKDVLRYLGKTHDVTFTGPESGPGGFEARLR